MKFVPILLVLFTLGNNLFAFSAPSGEQFEPYILEAARINNIELENMRFPIQKQILPASLSVIWGTLDIASYILGNDQGMHSLHVAVFDHAGETKTCLAYIDLKSDDSAFVQVFSCGTEGTVDFNGEELIPETKVEDQ